MRIFIVIIFGITFLECNPSKKLTSQIYEHKSVDIDIEFVLNKNDYSYQFKFLNNSTDTIEIIKPEISSGHSYFKKITANGIVSNEICAFFTYGGIEWIELLPRKQVVVNGRFNLKAYFCVFNDDDLLGFVYSGGFRRKDRAPWIFNFEIQPVAISKIDSISISKILF